jgi:SAM-dependent methyltransferase
MSSSWSGVADDYARSFARLCAGTVEPMLKALAERATPGGRLLDVGTGTGTVAAAAASRGFAVDGVDSSVDMLTYASRAHPKLTFVAGELPNLPYPNGTFDAGTANFVINHTNDPRASVRELSRVLAPGGTAAITIWPGSVSPMNALWNEVIDQSNARRPDGMRLPPEKDFERSVTGLDRLMTECGFVSIVVSKLYWSFDITPEDLWRPVTAGIAVIGATYQAQSRETKQRMTETFYRLAEERTTRGELHLPSEAIFAVAERPA